jgi:ABC-type glycerol-3-phosphate transport system substrate-binding protein
MIQKIRRNLPQIIILAIIVTSFLWWFNSRQINENAMANIPDYSDVDERSILAEEDIKSKLEPSFIQYYKQMKDQGAKDTVGVNIVIPAVDYTAKSGAGISKQSSVGGVAGEVLVQAEEDSWVEYSFDVPHDGFYQMGMSYYAMEGKRSSVLRSVQVDGVYPFYQAKKMEFQRIWKEAGETFKDNQENEYNPRQEEVFDWQYREFVDAEGKVLEPLRFYLSAGKHTIRLNAIREPVAIGEIRIFSPIRLPSYEELVKEYKEKGHKEVENQFIQKIQAEETALKSAPTLRRIEDREPGTEPFDKNASLLNAFGGHGWRNGGQWAEWEFEVPETGLYNLGIRFGNWFLNGIPVQRKITIDGEVPFREMNAVGFNYDRNWQLLGLGGNEHPYLFYLEKGKHRIRMEVQVGSLGEVFELVQQVSHKISLLQREIIRVTGTNPDPNRDYELQRSIPNLIPRIHLMAKGLEEARQLLFDLGVAKDSSQVAALGTARDQLLDMAEKPETITARLDQLLNTQSQLGLWITSLSQQSLTMDYIVVKSPEQKWPKAHKHWTVRALYSVNDFFRSFKKDYGSVGNIYGEEEKVLDVWVARGRDWVKIIKQLTDEDFTPNTGIKVNINVIPAGAMHLLMLSSTAGLAPDVALGVQADVPIDFAIRNAIVNLNQFPDYEEVAARFRPGAMIPYKYNGGDYALPENQNFSMLFYRKDIMQELGVTKIPDTWQEAMDLIPLLQQNGMDFFYAHAPDDFTPFLFQHGGEYYRENGKYSNLDSPEALKAMKMWTDLFTNYKISKRADFYNRFRSGEMPIGVADYYTYVLLSVAAPELTGWWGMKPMPGLREDNGEINRSTGGAAQTAMIFKDTEKKEEAWEYIKWWTSADIQEQFGSELEALLGVEARWNTANVEALKRLPWSTEDINAVLEQWEWFKEREIVLGGYFTTRHINNIWNEIVLNGKTVREAVEDGIEEINKELRKKREEFGLDVDDGPDHQISQKEGGGNR